MRTGSSHLAHVLALVLLAAVAGPPALSGQGRERGPERHGQRGPRNAPRQEAERDARKAERDRRAMAGLPPGWIERLQEMSPQEQEHFLKNNERFKSLPPDRQAQIRKRLQHWNSLTPERRAEVRRREQVWRQMSPEQQRYVREVLLEKWQKLPPNRRHVLVGKLSALRDLNDAERAAKLTDEAFLGGLSPDERSLLRELSNLRVGSSPEAPPEGPNP